MPAWLVSGGQESLLSPDMKKVGKRHTDSWEVGHKADGAGFGIHAQRKLCVIACMPPTPPSTSSFDPLPVIRSGNRGGV
jgi:hypothetical protein